MKLNETQIGNPIKNVETTITNDTKTEINKLKTEITKNPPTNFDRVKNIDPTKKPELYDKYKNYTINELYTELETKKYTNKSIDKIVIEFILYEINQARKLEKLPVLHLDPLLMQGAENQSKYMAKTDKFEHYGKRNKYYRDRAYELTGGHYYYVQSRPRELDYIHRGENIMKNPANHTAKEIIKLRMDSPGHRKTILGKDKNYPATHLGVGLGKDKDGKTIIYITIRTAYKKQK